MKKKSFIFNPVLLLSAVICGFIVMFNWGSRHPYLVFFQSKFLMILRYALGMGIFFLIFTAIRSLIKYLTENAPVESKRLFFQTDLITYLMLGPLLFKRFFIPGRHEGNRYYLGVFLGWFVLKMILMLIFFDRKVWAQFPKRIWRLVKKTPFIWHHIAVKREYRVTYLTLIFGYYLLLQLSFAKSFPKVSLLAPISYTVFFFSALLLLHAIVRNFLPKRFYSILIYASFLVCVLSTLDYYSFQVVNLHMNGSIGALLADGFKEIPKVLEGADVKMPYFILSVLVTFSVPLVGLWLYKRLPSKKVSFSLLLPLAFASLSLGTCYYSDQYIQKKLPVSTAQSLMRTFPVYPFFLKTQGEHVEFDHFLKPAPSQKDFENGLKALALEQEIRPHIFLFVIESFREDYLNTETAPYLMELKKSAPKFSLTASNSNVTHASLFTIYNGLYPHHWITLRDQNNAAGSFPLQVLKNSGYQLDAFHSSFFKYFNIGEVLFGRDYHLLDTLYEAKNLCPDVAKRDRMAIDKAKEHVSSFERSAPHYMTILLDSTHHHYYWPEDYEAPFTPYLKAFNYTNKGKGQLELTKNRYRNSIHYVDALVREFCEHLKAEGLYDSSVIIVTGDHGEEFLEFGHYFHGTDLCLPQSHVPLIYKFPKDCERKVAQSLTSHVDIFPTLFDLLKITYPEKLLEGKSIFSEHPCPYILSFRPQYKKNPYQFFLHNGQEKIEAKFLNSEDIYKSKGIELTAIKDVSEKDKVFKAPGASKGHALSLFKEPLTELFSGE